MHIRIVTVGKLKEKYLAQGIAEYSKRLGPYAKVEIMEVQDEKAPETMSAAEELQVVRKEGERILAQVKSDAYVIALAIEGQMWTSDKLAQHIGELGTYGRSQLAFIIGGSLGLSDDVMKRADLALSFGHITYPHQLLRLVLMEQLYRVFKILRGNLIISNGEIFRVNLTACWVKSCHRGAGGNEDRKMTVEDQIVEKVVKSNNPMS